MSDCAPTDDCVNTEGSFECLSTCAVGYHRPANSLHCIGMSVGPLTYLRNVSLCVVVMTTLSLFVKLAAAAVATQHT